MASVVLHMVLIIRDVGTLVLIFKWVRIFYTVVSESAVVNHSFCDHRPTFVGLRALSYFIIIGKGYKMTRLGLLVTNKNSAWLYNSSLLYHFGKEREKH